VAVAPSSLNKIILPWVARPIAGTDWFVGRLLLDAGKDGVHTLLADKPTGIQAIGYGDYTTYMYPGGLNLGQIAPVPPH